MLKPLDIQNPASWLVHAQHYNYLWHQCDEFLRAKSSRDLDEAEDRYYRSKRTMLLNQKLSCQMTALRLVYSQIQQKEILEHDLVLVLDPHEKGVSGDSVFYSLYSQQSINNRCHIPYSALLENLTVKEQIFFNIQLSI